MGFRWFNIIGFLMLLFALFLNEVVYLNVWYDFNLAVIVPAILYLGVGLWLSLWEGHVVRKHGVVHPLSFSVPQNESRS